MAKKSIYIYDEDTIYDIEKSFPDNSIIEIKGGVIFQSWKGMTFGNGCELRLKDGSVLMLYDAQQMTFGKNCILDARDGILDMKYAFCQLGEGSIFMLENYIVDGGTFIATYKDGEITGQPGMDELFNYKTGVSFEAPVRQVFSGNPKFEGKWLMPVAHPEWFCPAICDDWSEPINKAIEMKESGIVLLPKGFLKVKQTIWVNAGIQLIGNGNNRNNSSIAKGDVNLNERSGTTLLPPRKYSDDSGFILGCMVCVNINSEIRNAANKKSLKFETIQSAKGQVSVLKTLPSGNTQLVSVDVWENNHPLPGTMIKYINFDNTSSYIKELRGIFVAGGASFEYLNFRNLTQAIAWNYYYCDSKSVQHCSASYDLTLRNKKPARIPKLKIYTKANGEPEEYDQPYAFDLGNLGDALCFCYNHISADCINGVKLRDCGGGVMDGNIINADVRLETCKGLSFSNNHLEEGAQLRIIQSAVNVSGNYMHKGSRPNILISSGVNNQGSVVNLADNVIIYVQCYEYPSFKDFEYEETDENEKVTNSIFIPARESAEKVCDYDIAIFKYSDPTNSSKDIRNNNIININNSYRYWTQHGAFSPMNIFGLTFIEINKSYNTRDVTTPTYEITLMTEFNSQSQYLSTKSQVAPYGKINSYSYYVRGISESPSPVLETVGKEEIPDSDPGYWYGRIGYYRYQTQIFIDIDRKIAYPFFPQNEAEMIQYYISGNGTIGEKIKQRIKLVFRQESLMRNGNNLYVRIIRDRLANNHTTILERYIVDIPVCGATELYDYGKTIAGFNWRMIGFDESLEAATAGVDSICIMPEFFKASVIDSYSNVNFKKGDIIANIGNGQSWDIKTIK